MNERRPTLQLTRLTRPSLTRRPTPARNQLLSPREWQDGQVLRLKARSMPRSTKIKARSRLADGASRLLTTHATVLVKEGEQPVSAWPTSEASAGKEHFIASIFTSKAPAD